MYIGEFRMIKNKLWSITTIIFLTTAIQAETLAIKPYRADATGFSVSSVIVTGEKEVVLIDAQFTQADAYRVAADILSTGKKLTTIFISHGDPDFYFGLEAIKKIFPDVNIFAKQSTINHIKKTVSKKIDIWGPKLGANGPKNPIIPDVLPGNTIDLEGQTLEIINLGSDTNSSYIVWIPSLKAVVGGVVVFGDMHLWTADAQTKEARQDWIKILDTITEMRPLIVIPGHAKAGVKSDLSQVKFTKDYLITFEGELAKAKDSASLILSMKKKYPRATGVSLLELGAKVNKGEMKW